MLWEIEIGYEEQMGPDLYDTKWVVLRDVVIDCLTEEDAKKFGDEAAAFVAETSTGRDGESLDDVDVFANIYDLEKVTAGKQAAGIVLKKEMMDENSL